VPPRPQPMPATAADAVPPADGGSPSPVPEANRPGHHPEVEQDKPRRRPPVPKGSMPRTTTYDFRYDWPVAGASMLAGAIPRATEVEVGETHLRIRYGPWSLRTELTNVADVALSGPYSVAKVGGPPRLSRRDRGITFATTAAGGACIRFHRPVRAADPLGLLRHPAATVTVEDPRALKAELEAAVRRAS
jgi:hypothetical protein